MWRLTDWSKKSKWIVSSIIPILIIIAMLVTYTSPPSIIVNDVREGLISTENADYDLSGRVSSMKDATLKINNTEVQLTDDSSFSHKVSLKEGENSFLLVAANDNGETKKEVVVRRLTQAEIDARKNKSAESDEKIVENDKDSNNNSSKKSEKVEPVKPAYSSEDFTEWARTEVIAFYKDSFSANQDEKQERWAYINSKCSLFKDLDSDGDKDQYYDESCLQEQYKDYLKPEAFDYGSSLNNTEWACPEAEKEFYTYICSRFGDLLEEVKSVSLTGTGTELARIYESIDKIYQEVAVVKSQ